MVQGMLNLKQKESRRSQEEKLETLKAKTMRNPFWLDRDGFFYSSLPVCYDSKAWSNF